MKCEDCFFYRPDVCNRPQRGCCVRHAPRPVIRNRDSVVTEDVDWPLVWDNDWCGEYAAAKLPKPPPQVITKRP